jgi:hypothetical protein
MILKDLKGKSIGRWVVEDINYNVVTHKIDVNVTCIKCGYKKDLTVDNVADIKEINCSKCNPCEEDVSGNNREEEHKGLKYTAKDKYILDKLMRTWVDINKKYNVCEEWKNSFDVFEEWSLKNGYRYWKSLAVYIDEYEYNPDNCYWKLDNWGINKVENPIAEDNSLSNTVKCIKTISYRLDEMGMQLNVMDALNLELLESSYIKNKENISDCIKNIRSCQGAIDMCSKLIDNIKL